MSTKDKYAAGASALGYLYQARLGLLRMFEVDESTVMYIEKDDDLDFEEIGGKKTLASLKHKAAGDRMTNFSLDFWKSVKIWLERYVRDGKMSCTHQYQLFTTANAKELSFLEQLTLDGKRELESVLADMFEVLNTTRTKHIASVKPLLESLSEEERLDFISRIMICESKERIEEIPKMIIDQRFRFIQTRYRMEVFTRLEGWWNHEVIKLLTGERKSGLVSQEVSEKLGLITDEYKYDNLPIVYRDSYPDEEPDPDNDNRLFVRQLHAIGLKSNRISSAIVDYYRAFAQRAYWARTEASIDDEVERFQDRLIDEWGRRKDIIFDSLDANSTETHMKACGRRLYEWAEMDSTDLRIRERVNERYVVRGNFHMLANEATPRVHWHPRFLDKLKEK